jgi:ERCC4-related helicase
MTQTYAEFLERKSIVTVPTGIESVPKLNSCLFDFQRDITKWALNRGRAAVFAGTGLGKTLMQVEAAKQIEAHTKKPVLIFAPLAVASQTIEQAAELLKYFVIFAKTQEDIGGRGIYITNYQKREHFDPGAFGGVILDESSCLKSEDAQTRKSLVEEWKECAFRMAFTATPAPNDFMEIGGHAEFLGVMTTAEMLSTFFVHDGGETSKWRLKGHAEKDFWRWMASWCIALQHPRDLGYEDARYDLPPLNVQTIIVESKAASGELFSGVAQTLSERRGARRDSIDLRIDAAAKLVNSNKEQWLVWCSLNDEGEELTKAIEGAREVAGRHTDEQKESNLHGFGKNEFRVLVSKSKIAGWGMNWQNCHNIIYFPDDSFESYFQAIRRCWRFGQKETVNVWLIVSAAEQAVLENLKRKEREAREMYAKLITNMADFTRASLKASGARTTLEYKPKKEMKLPDWLTSEQNNQ